MITRQEKPTIQNVKLRRPQKKLNHVTDRGPSVRYSSTRYYWKEAGVYGGYLGRFCGSPLTPTPVRHIPSNGKPRLGQAFTEKGSFPPPNPPQTGMISKRAITRYIWRVDPTKILPKQMQNMDTSFCCVNKIHTKYIYPC